MCATRYLSMYMILQMSLNTKAAKNSPVDLPKPKKKQVPSSHHVFSTQGVIRDEPGCCVSNFGVKKIRQHLIFGNSPNHAGFFVKRKKSEG